MAARARRRSPRTAAGRLRRRLRVLPPVDRAVAGADGAARRLCAVAGGRAALSRDPARGVCARVPARAARRPRARGRGGRPGDAGSGAGRRRAVRARAGPGPRRRCSSWRTGWSRAIGAAASCSDAPALGALGREAHVFRRERALSPRARSLLPRGVRVALGPGGRAHRRARHPAGRPVSRLGARTDGRGAVLAAADALLALVERRVPAPALRGRRPRRAPARPGARAGDGAALCWALYLSLAIAGQVFLEFQWDYLLLEVGLLAIFLAPPRRWRFGRGLRGVAGRPLAPALAALPADVLVGLGQARERRPDLARPHRPALPLRDAAAAALDRAGTSTSSAVVPDVLGARALRRRARRAVSLSSLRGGCGSSRSARLVLLQVLIAATGNYGFFNLLALALAAPARRRPVAAGRAGGARPRPPPALRAHGRRPSSFRSRASCSSRRRSSSPERSTAPSRCRARWPRPRGAWRAAPQLQQVRPLHGDDDRRGPRS